MSDLEKRELKYKIESMSKLLLMPSCDQSLKIDLKSVIVDMKERLANE